jgi:hypothetical protein
MHTARKLMSQKEIQKRISPFNSAGFLKQASDRKIKQDRIMKRAEERRAEKAKLKEKEKKINKKNAKKLAKQIKKQEAKKAKEAKRNRV